MKRPHHATEPRMLAPGVRVALVAPAGPVDAARIEASEARCAALGLDPVVFPGAWARERYLAGSDSDRLADLQAALDDPGIGAVWALRGGYGTLRILDGLDLERQRRDPIPFIGFSDNTSVHVRHAEIGVISFHAPHPGGDFPRETEASFRSVLFRAEPAGALPTRTGEPEPRTLVDGAAEGPLVGGNLTILASMCGARHAVQARDSILFLEDVAEPAYRVDRMLVQLERSGAVEGVRGIAFGRFTGAPGSGEEGTTEHAVLDTLAEFAARIGVPAVANLPFGHVKHNCTLPVGAAALLDAAAATLTLTEAAVRPS